MNSWYDIGLRVMTVAYAATSFHLGILRFGDRMLSSDPAQGAWFIFATLLAIFMARQMWRVVDPFRGRKIQLVSEDTPKP